MAKRVAVIGGGLCGSVASHVLGSRGIKVTLYESAGRLGGKLGGVDKWLRASDSTNPYGQLLSHLETRGVIAPWHGQFGLLISGGAESPTKFWPVAPGTHLQAPAGRDWCGFIGGMAMGSEGEGGGGGGGGGGGSPSPLYVSANAGNEAAICEMLCEEAGAEVRLSTAMRGWSVGPGGWSVESGQAQGHADNNADADADADTTVEQYDALVLATGGSALPMAVVGSLAEQIDDGSGGGGGGGGAKALRVLSEGLSEIESQMGDVFVIKLAFDGFDSTQVPFSAAACDSEVVQWIARESSKPGSALRGVKVGTAEDGGGGSSGSGGGASDGEVWTGVSSLGWARELIDCSSGHALTIRLRLVLASVQ